MPDLGRTASLAILMTLFLSPFDEAGAEAAEARVELRTFIAHGEPRDRGLSCVVINDSPRAIVVWKGYDGGRNQLISQNQPHAIGLQPPKAPELQPVKVEPGMSETIFTLSLDAIFFLQPGAERQGWYWRWAGSPPRGMPPISPFHGSNRLGWEVQRADSGVVAAVVEVDGRAIQSKPLEIHAAKPPSEVVTVLARFQTARLVLPDNPRRYEISFSVQKAYEGSLSKAEQTVTLPDDEAERLLSAAGARPGPTPGTYTFNAPLMLLTFARILPEERRPSRLVLMAYERRPVPQREK